MRSHQDRDRAHVVGSTGTAIDSAASNHAAASEAASGCWMRTINSWLMCRLRVSRLDDPTKTESSTR